MKNFLSILLASALFLAPSLCRGRVARFGVRVVKEYPHSTSAYTQGLFFNGTQLCESAGGYGNSSFCKFDSAGGAEQFRIGFNRKYFIEGSAVLNGRLYILTWQEKTVFVYDFNTMKQLQMLSYPREGWGLTTDGNHLIASDGSDNLYFMDSDLHLQRSVKVTMGGEPVRMLNELEWVNGKIWANVYTTDKILIINPNDGAVEGIVDCMGLLPDYLRTPDTDVLNGIAVDNSDGSIYLTGKNWPTIFKIELTGKR